MLEAWAQFAPVLVEPGFGSGRVEPAGGFYFEALGVLRALALLGLCTCVSVYQNPRVCRCFFVCQPVGRVVGLGFLGFVCLFGFRVTRARDPWDFRVWGLGVVWFTRVWVCLLGI